MTAEKKKGLGALGWILIGCLGILLLGAVLTFACTFYVGKKAKDFASEVSDNPAMAAAEVIVKINPDLELVSSDDEAQTLTIYNKKTGEEITLDVKDIQEGKFSAKIGDKEVIVDPTSDQGIVQVSGGDDEGTFTLGHGDLNELPGWVLLYPDAKAEAPLQMKTPAGSSGTVSLETDDSIDEVTGFYSEQLEEAGFEVQVSTHSSGSGDETSSVTGTHGDKTITVVVTSEDGVTKASLTYSG